MDDKIYLHQALNENQTEKIRVLSLETIQFSSVTELSSLLFATNHESGSKIRGRAS
jgi:hypothetical protein